MVVVMESDKSFVDAMSYKLRTASNTHQIKFSPTCPAGVSNAIVYVRLNDKITTMEMSGHNYIVIVSDAQPNNVEKEIKSLAGSTAGHCQLVSGNQANDDMYLASKII